MSNALAALALLKTTWDYNRKDHLDSLMPHFATVIARRGLTRIEPEKMCRAFMSEWGWKIPIYVMHALIARAESAGVIKRSDLGDWVPVHAKVAEVEYRDAAASAQAMLESLVRAFVSYRSTKTGEILDSARAQEILLSYIAQYDLEIVSGSRSGGLLDSRVARGADLYAVGEFFLYCFSERMDLFESARQLALAQVFASTLTVERLDTYTGSVDGLHVYLDTRVILQALGIYGQDRRTWVREFLSYLRAHGAELRVFDHTYEEIETILENCRLYVESAAYNASLASHACRYFREIGATESDVEEFVVSMRATLEGLGIEYFEGSYDASENEFQVAETALRKAIENAYARGNGIAVHPLNDETLQRDVRSIALVHRMRRGAKPQLLSDAQHVFVTTNSGLARASHDLELDEGVGGVVVPDAVRDIFLATLLWLETPSGFEAVDASRFLADCHAAMQVDDALVARFLGKVERLRERGEIDDDVYYQLRMHRYALRVLGDVTLGDLDSVTDQTPLEVLARIEDRIRWEAEEKLRLEMEAHTTDVAALEEKIAAGAAREDAAAQQIAGLQESVRSSGLEHQALVETIADWFAAALAWPLFILVLVGALVAVLGDFSQGRKWVAAIQYGFAVLFAVISVMSLLNGFNVLDMRKRIKQRIVAALSRPRAAERQQDEVGR